MSLRIDFTTHRKIPSAISAFIEARIKDHLADLVDDNYKVKHYAGEFLAEDNINRLKGDVSQFPHVLYDVELIEEVENDNTQTMPEDTFAYIIFCCHSNVFDEAIQWSSSYELAWDVRTAFQGLAFASAPNVVANGFFIPSTIERELHVPGMSVHTFRLEVQIIHDING